MTTQIREFVLVPQGLSTLLSSSQLKVALALFHFCKNDTLETWVGVNKICLYSGLKKAMVSRTLRNMQRLGLIIRRRRRRGGGEELSAITDLSPLVEKCRVVLESLKKSALEQDRIHVDGRDEPVEEETDGSVVDGQPLDFGEFIEKSQPGPEPEEPKEIKTWDFTPTDNVALNQQALFAWRAKRQEAERARMEKQRQEFLDRLNQKS